MSGPLPRILVQAPGGPEGIAAVVSSGRAGALGLLDLASTPEDDARAALRRLERWADRPFGVVLAPGEIRPDEWPERLSVVVCRGGAEEDWRSVVEAIRASGRRAVAEVSSRSAASKVWEAGTEAVIVSGLEAGGRCGEESSFVMLQAMLGRGVGPVWVRGGIGPGSASACVAAGAAGVVLDGAVLLARESPLGDDDRDRIARLDGGEPERIGPEAGPRVRVDAVPGSVAPERLREAAARGGSAWVEAEAEWVGWLPGQARPIGQDAAFAAGLAARFGTVGGIVRAVEEGIDKGVCLASSIKPLAPGSPMAGALGTRYPIVQGPMTRVSDAPEFARAVADGGALPMLALAMLRGPETAALLSETAEAMGGNPWGVGLLGFVDPAIRTEQLEAIRAVRPPFALIAGGRPDQAADLESIGVRTFLHAPSPGLLSRYLRDGARRFVLEGRECGGHVGPRSSLVLWEQAASEVLGAIDSGVVSDPGELHLLFAGGVHDARSAAAVAAVAAPLAEKGVKVGVLVGTAYLFTREAVETGAIAPRFQAEAVRCRETVLLPTGPGHEVRAVPSPFTSHFDAERRRMSETGASAGEIREALERLNVGRLRVASKGMERAGGPGSPLEPLPEAEQYDRGLYMIGQVATLRDRVTTIHELHEEICSGSLAILRRPDVEADIEPPSPSDVAIVGLSALFPGAGDVRSFWENTIKGVDSIVEVPPDRWDWRLYYDPDPSAPDKVISRWGGFLPDIPFDPLRYGMPPSSLPSIEPAQLLVLEAVRAALDDAGYTDRPFPRDRTAVVLGMGGGAAQLAMGYAFRSYLPMLESIAPEIGRIARARAEPLLPEWTEDAFPGFLLNVTAGRVANRFNLGGANYTVDAACGSSLAAASLAVRELETGAADVVILGGADTVQNPLTYLAFSKTHAFSPRGQCRPFDASADGIVISEGVGVLVLKRLADAERDGDRIYAVIKGVGSSSDGRDRGLTAPNGEGQARALARAYHKAGVSPASVGYVEAHGTGTAVGDVVEVNALSAFLRGHGAGAGSCVIGSVKSMIGHTKCAAGLAGLINATLSLYHRALPPTIGVERLNPDADLIDGPVQVGTKARPWLHAGTTPRRAGVSAFGFGGTNFHAVIEAYEGDPIPRPATIHEWPAELFVWRAPDRSGLLDAVDRLIEAIDSGARPRPRDLAHSLALRLDPDPGERPTLAIVSGSIEELRNRLSVAREKIGRGDDSIDDRTDVLFSTRPEPGAGRVALVFPGQGAQRLEMLGELAIAFEEVRCGIESFDAALVSIGRRAIGPLVFPPTTLDDAARERARFALMATDVAQPAVGAVSVGMLNLFNALGIEPTAVGGHSYGELVALYAAGSMDVEMLARLSECRGRLMAGVAGPEPGSMAALMCDETQAVGVASGIDGLAVANLNGPRQTVISGSRDALNRAIDLARGRGIRCFDLPVGGAFHSPIVAGASGPMAQEAASAIISPPGMPVFSNLDGAPHPADPTEIARRLGDHLASPVRFGPMIESMYESDVRTFIECGPGTVLAPLIRATLGDRPHLAISSDTPGRPAIPTLLKAIARLVVAGVPVRRLTRLTERRGARRIDPDRPPISTPPFSRSTWLVNGSRARPASGPEPERLGMAPELIGREWLGTDRERSVEKEIANARIGEAVTEQSFPRPHETRSNGAAQQYANGWGSTGSNGHQAPIQRHPLASRTQSSMNNGQADEMPGREGNHAHRCNEQSSGAIAHDSSSDPGSSPRPAADQAMMAFQETMRAFLDVQRQTMVAYLSGGSTPELPDSRGDMDNRSCKGAPAGGDGERVQSSNIGDPITRQTNVTFRNREHKYEGLPRTSGNAPQELGNRSNGAGPRPEDPGPRLQREESASGRGSPPEKLGGSVAERLIEIVRDRTGYPAEMLGMGLDLEADLGIDSIKRVEILGSLRDSVDGMTSTGQSGLMDRLARSKTLGEIVSLVESARDAAKEGRVSNRPEPGERRIEGESATVVTESEDARIDRLVLEAIDAPVPWASSGLAVGGTVVVTDDGRGIAEAIAGRLRTDGLSVEVAASGWADPTSPSSVADWLDRVRPEAGICGLIHAQPLTEAKPAGLDPDRWATRMDSSLRGLFHLARAAAEDLERSSRRGGACLIAATSMGGAFGSVGAPPDGFFPGDGAIAGLVKTLAREWNGVRTRVVDLDPDEPALVLADRLASEARLDDGWPEVGYRDGRRIRLALSRRPIRDRIPVIAVRENEPILITGGARGISAAVAIELAHRWRPTLLLVGTSPMPTEFEEPDTAGLQSDAELKRVLLDRARRSGQSPSPHELERLTRSHIRAREIRETLRAIKSAGATVEYAPVDVRNASALAGVLEAWTKRYGDPVGLIHGAGVIHDKLLCDKTPESFDAVLGTKLDGALNLARLLRGDALKFSALFSSIAGRFGNQGQSDYASANEALNKLAHWLDRRWPGRVVSVNWGPWSGVGMVSELEGHLGRRGLGMIEPTRGCAALVDELRCGRKGEVEVILSGALGRLDGPLDAASAIETGAIR